MTTSAKTSAKKSTGPWTKAARRRLSAIRVAQDMDPADFTFAARSARDEIHRRQATAANTMAGLGELAKIPDEPEVLTVESERERVKDFAAWVGGVDGLNTWSTSKGRVFTDEGWNPFVGLWLGRGGWSLVLSLVIPDLGHPLANPIGSSDISAPWYALRRYLHRASPQEYATVLSQVEPAFRKLFDATKRGTPVTIESADLRSGRDHIAFAFDRETTWATEILADYVTVSVGGMSEQKRSPKLALLTAVCADAALSQRSIELYGHPLSNTDHVFDMLETLGAQALPILEGIVPRDAPARKRIAEAVAIAEKLAE